MRVQMWGGEVAEDIILNSGAQDVIIGFSRSRCPPFESKPYFKNNNKKIKHPPLPGGCFVMLFVF